MFRHTARYSARGFTSRRVILNQLQSKTPEAPAELAQDSHLPKIPQDLKINPRAPRKQTPLRPHEIEDPNYHMSGWKQKIGQLIIKTFGIDMDRSRAGPVAGSIYFGECKQQGLFYPDQPMSVSSKFYYETLGLPQSFSQWFQITALHYWMLSVRMRAMPFKYGRNYQQKLVDRIFKDMELRMSDELNINSNRIIEGYLKDYHAQLLGSVLSYDEAFVSDDITMAAALWRNVFNGDPNVDMRHLEALTGYVRGQLYVLDQMSDREFGFGQFRFVPPNEVVKPLTSSQRAEIRERVHNEFAKMDLPSQRSQLSLDE
ncbi:protein Cbp3p, mitochondrial [Diutina catenulata]